MSACCPRCKRPCHSAEGRLALNQSWHIECFTCAICNRALDSVSLYECRMTGEVYCRQCFKRYCSTPGYGYGASLISDLPVDCFCTCQNNCNYNTTKPQANSLKSPYPERSIWTPPPAEGNQRCECHCVCCSLCTVQPKLYSARPHEAGDMHNIQHHFSCEKIKPMVPDKRKKNCPQPPAPSPMTGFWKNSFLLDNRFNTAENRKTNPSIRNDITKTRSGSFTFRQSNSDITTTRQTNNPEESILETEETSWITGSACGETEEIEKSKVSAIVKKFSDTNTTEITNKTEELDDSHKKTSLSIDPEQNISNEDPNIFKIAEKWKTKVNNRKYHKQTFAEIADGLMKLNYSEPLQKHEQDEQNVALSGNENELEEKPKSFWDRLNIFSTKTTNNPEPDDVSNNNEQNETSASEDDEVAFAMAVEDKRLLNIRKVGKLSLTSKELENLNNSYDEIESNHSKPLQVKVKTSKSELNESFEHMKTISQHKINCASGSGQTKSSKKIYCQGCFQEILEQDEDIITLSKEMHWHSKCFKCSKCQVQLNERNYFLHGKWLYCITHYAEAIHAPKCEACKQYIMESSYTLAKGRAWHKDHFRCSNCKIPIIDSKFVILAHEQIVCFQCYEKYFTKICQTCRLKIKPTEQFVFHKDFYWHAKEACLHCNTCGQNLVGRQTVFFKDAVPYCSKYCAVQKDSVDK